jgi:hypothetical protein
VNTGGNLSACYAEINSRQFVYANLQVRHALLMRNVFVRRDENIVTVLCRLTQDFSIASSRQSMPCTVSTISDIGSALLKGFGTPSSNRIFTQRPSWFAQRQGLHAPDQSQRLETTRRTHAPWLNPVDFRKALWPEQGSPENPGIVHHLGMTLNFTAFFPIKHDNSISFRSLENKPASGYRYFTKKNPEEVSFLGVRNTGNDLLSHNL